MSARRCPVCLTDWPADHRYYGTCPLCVEPTDFVAEATAMNSSEARSRRLHIEFERYFAAWDRKRVEQLRQLEAQLGTRAA